MNTVNVRGVQRLQNDLRKNQEALTSKMAATRNINVRVDHAVADEFERLMNEGELPYDDMSTLVNQMLVYTLLTPKRHYFGEGYAEASREVRYQIHDFAAEVSRRNLTAKGQLLEAIFAGVDRSERDPGFTFARVKDWAKRFCNGDETVWAEISSEKD